MFVAFLYFLLFYIDFLLLGKSTYSFDRALSTVKNCPNRLFDYFEILLFMRLKYGISRE